MENLQKDGLGNKVLVVERTTVFNKIMPRSVEDEALAMYKVEHRLYEAQFKERAPHNQSSKELFNSLLDNFPDKIDLNEWYKIMRKSSDDP